MAFIDVRDVSKDYLMGEITVNALKSVFLSIEKGEFISIMGPSGSGKSTFMNIIGCLDRPTSGEYLLEGMDVSNLGRDRLASIRNKKLGFVFQGFNLLPRITAIENVELPMLYNGVPSKERTKRAMAMLEAVGLRGREMHRSNQLSGGQQQRIAIARALVNNASIILADEPTGNLDTKTSAEIMELFKKLNEDSGITVILITHERDIAHYGKRLIEFLDGKILKDTSING